MATEPERPIEKLLRAFAGKRREQSGGAFVVHPATRRLLQGEVKRRFAASSADSSFSIRGMPRLWPGIAWGLATCFLLAAGTWLWFSSRGGRRDKSLMAENTEGFDSQPAGAVALPPSSPAPELAAQGIASPIASSDESKVDRKMLDSISGSSGSNDQNDRLLMLAKPAAGEGIIWKTNSLASSVERPTDQELAYEAPMAVPSVALAAEADSSNHSFGAPTETPPNVRTSVYRFAQVAPQQPILASFQMEQAGRELRIIDGDGSIYKGYVQLGETAARKLSVRARLPAAPSTSSTPAFGPKAEGRFSPGESAAQNYFFRVTGTNRSRKQILVFVGNFMASNNPAGWEPATSGLTGASGAMGGWTRNAQTRSGAGLAPGQRIVGKATLGAGKEIEVNAVRTGP